MDATSQLSGSSANGARFGRLWVWRVSPVSGSVTPDGGEIDRAEIAHKARVGDTKADLRRSPWVVAFLSAENVAEGIADGDEVADDPGVFGKDSIGSLAAADRDGDGGPIDDLEKRVVFENVAAFLNGGPFRGGADPDIRLDRKEIRGLLGWGFLDARGQAVDGAVEESWMPPFALGRHV